MQMLHRDSRQARGIILRHSRYANTIPPPFLRGRMYRFVHGCTKWELSSFPLLFAHLLLGMNSPRELQGRKLRESDAVRYLADVGMDPQFLRQNSADLSGGQRQKVSIARTLINRPKILLLDEITSALDQTSLREIEELIVKINRAYGVTIVWITHNLKQAVTIGDFTWVLHKGEVIETGESDLLKTPATDFVKRFVQGETE